MKETFSKEESFTIITKMINQAKNEYSDKGDGWLLWGWLLFIASASSAIFEQIDLSSYVRWVWNGMGLIVIIYFLYKLVLKKNTHTVKTYVEEMLKRFGFGFMFSVIVTIIATSIKGDGFAFGYFFILYAFWMFIHGSTLRYNPLIIGAVINWAAAILIFITHDFKYIMIISAIAVAFGYLVPGYMLRNQYKNLSKNKHGV